MVFGIIASCSSGNDKNNNISTEDSIENILLGTWKEDGKKMYLVIEKADELYTVTNNAGITYAYKLNGQILTSVDETGPTYSLIGKKKLLKGSSKYSKIKNKNITEDTENNENVSLSSEDITSESTNGDNEKSTSTTLSKPSGSSSKSSSNTSETKSTKTTSTGFDISSTSNTRSPTTKTTTATPKQLIIVCNGITYLRQSPNPSGAVIRGLANGQECPIIKRGNLSKAYGKTDYWYQVKAEGDKGWVFGSLTNLSQSN